ncbi:hypothetical protein [Tautonia plasticadhaerens]|uniref:Uncharacterized protein n=1 Tax=Tautonia plasticadhaerens TaxID=2527974 RepID=A0A518GYS1_9BACT|nr:hypothetical protein [Tautonia plasticadhaerens]QDV33751.1 hypothetical protein ElP_16300 [Tautonia plasticadhaerens]
MATIIGIDLGKFKGVACTFTPESREAASSKIPTDPGGWHWWLAQWSECKPSEETAAGQATSATRRTRRMAPHSTPALKA